jgi:hypothetical protein
MSWGIAPTEFRRLVNTYYYDHQDHGRDPVTGPYDFDGSRVEQRKGEFIKRYLGADKPVIWLHLSGGEVQFYYEADTHVVGDDRLIDRDRSAPADRIDYKGNPLISNNNPLLVNAGDDYYSVAKRGRSPSTYKAHYVAITEYIVDEIDGTEKVVFATWGEKMVADLSQTDFGIHGGFYQFPNDWVY